MNSRPTISLSKFSKGRWPDEPLEPPPHPAESNPVAKVQSWLSQFDLPARMRTWLGETSGVLARLRSRLGEPGLHTRVWSSFTDLAPLTFAQYLIAFFIGVVATTAWQSYRGATKETVAAAPAALDSMRQSVDRLAAEVTRIRAVEQDILERISASPPQPVAAPARNPAPRSSPVR